MAANTERTRHAAASRHDGGRVGASMQKIPVAKPDATSARTAGTAKHASSQRSGAATNIPPAFIVARRRENSKVSPLRHLPPPCSCHERSHIIPGADCCHRKGSCGRVRQVAKRRAPGTHCSKPPFPRARRNPPCPLQYPANSPRRSLLPNRKTLPSPLPPPKVSLQFIRWVRVGFMRPTYYRPAI